MNHSAQTGTFDFTGIMTAIVTPFSNDGTKLDFGPVDDLIALQADGGASAIVVGGSTGEHAYLTIEERQRLMEEFAARNRDRLPLIMHVGAMRQQDAVALAARARDLGADGLLVIPPYYDAPAKDLVGDYLKKVHDAADLPFALYESPRVTGIRHTNDELAALRRDVGVQAVKDSRGDFTDFVRGLNRSDTPSMLGGADLHLLGAFASGAKGTVIGASAFIPELCAELYRAVVLESDLAAGRAVWGKLYPILDFLLNNGYIALTKAGAEMRGIAVGPPKPPLLAATDEARGKLRELLQDAGVETVGAGDR